MDVPIHGTWWMLRNWLQCYCGDTLSGVQDLTKLDFQSLTLAFCYYSSDSSFFFLTEEFTLLRKAPDSSGSDSSAVISLCVIFANLHLDLFISDLARYSNQSTHLNRLHYCSWETINHGIMYLLTRFEGHKSVKDCLCSCWYCVPAD